MDSVSASSSNLQPSSEDWCALQNEVRQLRVEVSNSLRAPVSTSTTITAVLSKPILLGSTRAPSVTVLEDSTVDAPSSAPVIASSSKPAQVLPLPPADLHLAVLEPALLAKLQNPCEYVDLENCLPQNRAKFSEIERPATSTGRGRGAEGSEKRRIRSFDDWLEAFSLFSRFRGYYAPEFSNGWIHQCDPKAVQTVSLSYLASL
ncbi:hypothetical protein RvY_08335 [Ramazzottius varieornatus]|uniref:Uncharacterized protein n=1 Tax=Ramazzottius varieornatus TaxID=947166 RepID=A0A1D1VA52_RAMVA|nr:hypothetical protein RvY_08335 [Ramazzottius varieornatus]